MEATVAVNFILSYLYNKLPRRRVDMFGELLEQMLQSNLEGFWASQFSKSNQLFAASVSFRYIFHCGVSINPVDPLINQVAASCLIDVYEILSYFPESLSLFLEPGKVQYSVNPSEPNVDIWKSDQRKYEMFELLKQGLVQPPGLESHSQECEPGEKISVGTSSVMPYSSTFAWQKPGQQVGQSSAEGCFIQKSSSTPNFTAASFAQTKFGSTKLKSQLKRSSRISTYLAQQRSIVAAISTLSVQEPTITTSVSIGTTSPSSLSPYFDTPTAMPTQRSISLSPCVRPQRGHSPPFFNMPLILPPFTSSTESMGMFPSLMTSTAVPSSATSSTVPSIHITRVDNTPVTFVVTNVDDPYPWSRHPDQ